MATKFGVQTPQISIYWPELLRIWQYLDDSPFESAWTMDHLVPGRTQGESNGPAWKAGRSWPPWPRPLGACASAAW